MIREIVEKGDAVLTKRCHPVTRFDRKLALLLDDMRETLVESGGVGLAAPQVGILRRVALVMNEEEHIHELINPEKHIEPIITQLTGISDETVKDKPTFKQLAQTLADKFAGSDFAGFNSNNFDIPLLAEEFLRAGIDFDFSKSKLIDACAIFRKMERRNLASAYKFYCGRKMEEDFEAHRADQDTEATYRVLMGQLDKYAPGANEDPEKVLENDMQKLAEFSKMNKNVDFAGRIVWSEVKDAAGKPVLDEKGEPKMIEVFNFGKY